MSLKTLIIGLLGRKRYHRLMRVYDTKNSFACQVQTADSSQNAKPDKKRSKGSTTRRNPKYKRLNDVKRIQIMTLLKRGDTKADIARAIGCDRSTITRELARNKSKKGYRHKKANSKARHRVAIKAANRKKIDGEMWEKIKKQLAKGWTPEMISERARKDKKFNISKETIYKEYYRRQELVMCGESKEDLPMLPKRRKLRKIRDRNAKKYRNAGRGKIPDRVDIDERPNTVLHRTRIGNWEGDLINGLNGTGHIVTLVERMTRMVLYIRIPSKETNVVMAAIIGLLGVLPKDMLKTITFDNGKEFAGFKQLEQALGLKVYFAKPYHSWERGTNENRNGVVRMVLPKGRAFDNILETEYKRIDYLLNDRPLSCLNWRTPREAFESIRRRYLFPFAA